MASREKSCPNCGAELKSSCCEFCGYTPKKKVERAKGNDTSPLALAHPELFDVKFNKFDGVVVCVFKIKGVLSDRQYITISSKHNLKDKTETIGILFDEYDEAYYDDDVYGGCTTNMTFRIDGNRYDVDDGMSWNTFKMFCTSPISAFCFLYDDDGREEQVELTRDKIDKIQMCCRAFLEAFEGTDEYRKNLEECLNIKKGKEKELRIEEKRRKTEAKKIEEQARQERIKKYNRRNLISKFLMAVGLIATIVGFVWMFDVGPHESFIPFGFFIGGWILIGIGLYLWLS